MHYTQIFTQNYLNALIFVVCSRSKNEYLPHLDLKSTILCYNVLRAAGNVKMLARWLRVNTSRVI